MYSSTTKSGFVQPRGGALISLIVALTAVLTGGLGLLILDAVTCDFNVIFSSGCGSSGGGGGGGGAAPVSGGVCTSAPNACGMTNTGFLESATQDGVEVGLACNATVPPISSCPSPTIGVNDFYAQPSIIKEGDSSTLHWTSSDSTGCTITGDNGFSYTGDTAGTVSTGPINQTTTFSLTCENGVGGPQGTANIKVTVTPKFQEI